MKKIATFIKDKFSGRLSKACFKRFSIQFIKNYISVSCIVFLFFLFIRSILQLLSLNLSNMPSTLDLSLLFVNLIILPIYAIASIKPIIGRLHDMGIHGTFFLMPFFLFILTVCLGFKFGVSAFSLLPIPLFITFTLLSLINGTKNKNQYGYPKSTNQTDLDQSKTGGPSC